jgi:Heparinase II/III-like protein/Heparinase II/III N-terminus
MHLLLCALILGQHERPSEALVALVRLHLQRIAPTMSYAIAQQNNHGTSEAAALFMGGIFLARNGVAIGNRWHRQGRKWLEDRASNLIESDGSFSQYSVVYHRLMLDTYSLCETWRRVFELPSFSANLIAKLGAATQWMYTLVAATDGNAPNIGANDGAHIAKLSQTDFRDFRPTVQWASALFLRQRAFADRDDYDQPLLWLDIQLDLPCLPPQFSRSFNDGGWHVLHQNNAMAVMRYPRFKFRPSQCDALHLDLWVSGQNLLRDSGSYSYNPPLGETIDFGATAAHNSIAFDNLDQMPRLSKFLYGSWLESQNVRPVETTKDGFRASAGYIDYRLCEHDRIVEMSNDVMTCTDIVRGPAKNAMLRWHLAGSSWYLDGNAAIDSRSGCVIHVGSENVAGLAIGMESQYYLEKSEHTVLEINLSVPSTVVTTISFRSKAASLTL